VSDSSVLIIGIGMTTAVGLSSAETAASVRAGTMRFVEGSFLDKRYRPLTLAEVPEDPLPPIVESLAGETGLTALEQRLLRLATQPLHECLRPLAGQPMRPGMCLALPAARKQATHTIDRSAFLRRLYSQVGGTFDPARSDASHSGRAGGIAAIGQAVAAIRSGVADVMLAGAIDSYRDLSLLAMLDQEQRVKTGANLDGFIPGEGAGFLLIASPSKAASLGVPILATLSPVAQGFEAGHLESTEPYRGDGLANAFRQLVAIGAVDAPINDVYSSMNGESHWAKEWGVGYLRNRSIFDESHAMHHPADCYGELGAACGPVLVGLAATGIARGYRRAPALVYGSSDDGARCAVVVGTAH
jgi:3-oxoacyl-[acyl-carrier-protein] synthase-1